MRVIAGKFKGLKLNNINNENIRPTADRVKEAIFSKIQFDIKDCKFLDLFSGTGAVGIEAISRGADFVQFCDNNKNSVKLIRQNLNKANINNYSLFEMDFIACLNKLNVSNIKFDFIFIDCIFNTNHGQIAIDLIQSLNLLNKNGMIIYEHIKNKEYKINENLKLIDSKSYGTIQVDYIIKN